MSFICIPQSTRALDQGGVEPRQAVSPKALRPWTIPLRYSVGSNEDYGQGDRADIQHRREQERDVRGATKTIAQLALEMSHVHRLADLIKEKADLLKELAMRRKSYQDEVKESAKGKLTAASSAPKKQRTTGAPASVANPVPTPLPTAHGGKAMDVDARGGASQSSATPFPWPFTQSPSTSSTPAAPTQHDPPSVPAPATKPDVQQDDPASGPTQKGVQAGAPPIPRAWVGGWGPRYLVPKRERGSARIPRSLGED